MINRQRLDYVDFIRGIGILTIVFVHLGIVAELPDLDKYVMSFQMFLFFFVSGYLFHKEKAVNYEEYVQKQAWHLLVPYILFSIISWQVNADWGASEGELYLNSVQASLSFGAIWFLLALFICNILCSLFITRCKKVPALIFCGILCIPIGIYLNNSLSVGFLRIPQGLVGVFFYIAGYLFRQYEPKIQVKHNKIVGWLGIVLGLITAMLNEKVHLSAMELGIIPLSLISALLTILGAFYAFRGVHKGQNLLFDYILFLGRNTLVIMCTHIYIIYSVESLYRGRIVADTVFSPIYYMVIILVLLTQSIIILLWNQIKKKTRELFSSLK